MGSEQYAYFSVETEGVESDQLSDLAEDAGTAEVPSAGAGTVVARFDAASKVKRGEEIEVWVDATKLHFFDSESGDSLRA